MQPANMRTEKRVKEYDLSVIILAENEEEAFRLARELEAVAPANVSVSVDTVEELV